MKHLLLRSSWQTVNIGDIGHTPGALQSLREHLPDARVTLWPADIEGEVEPFLRRWFPEVDIVKGDLDAGGRPDTPALREAFETAHFFLHGSGPSLVAARETAAWRDATDKPYGFYGVTIERLDDEKRDLLSGAEFVYCRDTRSLEFLRAEGVACPEMDFAPDAAFGMTIRDDAAADRLLAKHDLEADGYLCVIPRLRVTPYHQFKTVDWDERRIAEIERLNAETKEKDHAKFREAIVAWVRETGKKVLVCPEVVYHLDIAGPLLVDPLPADVAERVVRMERFWLPDEAAAVYARSCAVLSFPMHSPIFAFAQGVPAVYARQPTDTCKGQMWRDVGLAPWILEIDEVTGADVARTILDIHADREAAEGRLAEAARFVARRQRETMAVVGRLL